MFVHLAPESRVAAIRRVGIRRARRPWGAFPGGVFAVPVTPDFSRTHQWVRELRRWAGGPVAGVYFRIPDDEPVWVGHYGRPHRWMTAARAAAVFLRGAGLDGWEVVIPRPIPPAAIHRTRRLPQVVGWRYAPGAHGTRPCPCDFCQRGQYGARRVRVAAGRPSR
jgi:hypothetical protein